MRLVADELCYAYRVGHDVLRGITLAVESGNILYVLGANGSGKTTLLDCLSGIRTPHSGYVAIDNIPLANLSIRERARRLGVVPQMHEPVFSYTVEQAVLMARAPHMGLFAHPGKEDIAAVEQALHAVGIARLRDRPYTEISGGERQLVLIARGLAQGAGCLLMDEPAAHLDPRHQQDILGVVAQLADDGFSFVVTSHHPNNALLHADTVVCLAAGSSVVCGTPEAAITEEGLQRTYGMEFAIIRGEDGIRAVLPRAKRRQGAV